MVRPTLLLVFAGTVAAALAPAVAAPLGPYQALSLGLTGAEHTRTGGFRSSVAHLFNDSGLVAGVSDRFFGSNQQGLSSWLYDSAAGTTTRIGFIDAEHTRTGGYRFSFVTGLTESGLAAGFSERWNGEISGGGSAWLYDSTAGTTTRLGFLDAEHTSSDGYQASQIVDLTESGLAAGLSTRLSGTNFLGTSSWLYDSTAGTTTRVGFIDAAHTGSDGTQQSFVSHVTESGAAAGASTRWDGGGVEQGISAWLYDGAAGTTTRVGLLDADHTGSGGYQESFVSGFNEAGLAVGGSSRYSGPDSLGASAWLYDSGAGTTTRLGFLDADHTGTGGYQESYTDFLTQSGLVAGSSRRFSGADELGASAWLYDSLAANTTRLGLLDAAHTAGDGRQESWVDLLTESGFAAGGSARYDGLDPLGFSAWLHENATASTTRIGLFDAGHTRSDGYQDSSTTALNDSGLVAGVSTRFDGVSYLGQSGWIYDAVTDTEHSIVLSTRSDGYAWATLSFLDDGGLALGSYELFDSFDNSLEQRAFAWTAGDGAVDLGSLVAGGLGAAGWGRLADAIHADGLGQIVGNGLRSDFSHLAYLLVPVPEPGALLVLAVGLGGLALQRQQRGLTRRR